MKPGILSLAKSLFFVLLFFMNTAVKAQEKLFLQWVKKLESKVQPTEGSSNIKNIQRDASGNIYVTGGFSGTTDFDPGEGVANLVSAGQTDLFFAKYDANGNYIYAHKIGGRGYDTCASILIDKLGNIYLTGKFSGTVDFDPGESTANLTSYKGYADDDAFFAKYDSKGNYVFAKNMGGMGNDYASVLAFDNDGNIYVAGRFEYTVDFDPGEGVSSLESGGSDAVFLAKYSPRGLYLSAYRLGSGGSCGVSCLLVDTSGNVYIAGTFRDTVNFDPGKDVAKLKSNGFSDIYIAKYDKNGNYIFAKSMGGNTFDHPSGIALDNAGNLYMTGEFYQTVDFDPGEGVANLTSAGKSDFFIAKYDAKGNYVFVKQIGGKESDSADELLLDCKGNIYILGTYQDTVDFDPDAGVENLTSSGGHDIFMAKYDEKGNFIYAKGIGGIKGDHSGSFTTDCKGKIYVTGFFRDTADFDPTANTYNLHTDNLASGFFACYSENANEKVLKKAPIAKKDLNKEKIKKDLKKDKIPTSDLAKTLGKQYFESGRSKDSLGDYEGAFLDYTLAIAGNYNASEAYYKRGTIRIRIKNYKDAIEDFNKAIELNPNYEYAYYNRGDIKYLLEDYNGAIEDFDKTIALRHSGDYLVYYKKGLARFFLKDYKGSVEQFDKAIELKPASGELYFSRGISKSYINDNKGVIDDLSKSIELNYNAGQSYFNRGNAKYVLKDYKSALEDFNIAIKLDPKNGAVFYNRAMCKFKIDDIDKGCSDVKEAEKLGFEAVNRDEKMNEYCK